MADRYVDSATGSNSDNGTTPALAWATIQYALSQISAGDDLWVRRGHSEIPTASLNMRSGASYADMTRLIGWPRGTLTGTATFTHGSTTVSSVNITCTRAAHCGRFIKNDADGRLYLITYIPSTSSFVIDRPYVGTTASEANFTISADEDYSIRPSAGQTPWDGDAHTLPKVDFTGTPYALTSMCTYHFFAGRNLEVLGGTNTDVGCVAFRNGRHKELCGCVLSTTANNFVVRVGRYALLRRCIISGSGSGSSQTGIWSYAGRANVIDCAIYGMGGVGVGMQNEMNLKNVNIGVEVANGGADISILNACAGYQGRLGIDVKLGGTNGYVATDGARPTWLFIENYQKTLGRHYSLIPTGVLEKVSAGTGTPIPDQRSSGATSLLEVLPKGCMTGMQYGESLISTPLFEHEFEASTDSKSYRYYVQTNISGGLTASDLWIEAEYVDQYDSASEYHTTQVKSDESVSARSGITDWSQFIEVTGIQPAVASKLRIRGYLNKYDATNKVWIDPKVVIS